MSERLKGKAADTIGKEEEPLGEVVEASTPRLTAECPRERLHAPPDLGTFIKVLPPGVKPDGRGSVALPLDPFADPPALSPGLPPPGTPEGTLYALVFHAATGGAEPGRRAAAYGLDEEQLLREQPQIFDLLATQFDALHLAYVERGRLRSGPPPRPPRLHAFVYACTDEETCALTESPDLLRRLAFASGVSDADSLIVACLHRAYLCRNNDFTFLVRAGKQLAHLLRDDPERLTALLRCLEPGA